MRSPPRTAGDCFDNVNPRMQLNVADPFWVANGPFSPEIDTGCGYDLSSLPGITALGRHNPFTPTAVNLAYIPRGTGRIWLVESDWSDGDPTFTSASRKLMRYMVGTK